MQGIGRYKVMATLVLLAAAMCQVVIYHQVHIIPVGRKKSLSQFGIPREIIGVGATSTVYRYEYDNITSFAVKKFKKKADGVDEGRYTQLVKSELEISRGLTHKAILPVRELLFEEGYWFQIMDYIPSTLWHSIYTDATRPDSANLATDQLPCIFRQLVHGISHMHGRGIAHLDLKLNNVLLTNNNQVKIIDFGNAQRFRERASDDVNPVTGVRGTVPFVPPEAYLSELYDPRGADVWALGIIACQMLLPALPWTSGTIREDGEDKFTLLSPPTSDRQFDAVDVASLPTMHQSMDQVMMTVHAIVDKLPLEWQSIIMRMLDLEPNHRITLDEVVTSPWVQGIEC